MIRIDMSNAFYMIHEGEDLGVFFYGGRGKQGVDR
jgi:hypothetical protein